MGAFLAAPNREVVHRSFGGTSSVAGSGQATGTFDHLGLTGTSGTGGWTATDIGAPTPHAPPGSTRPGASTVTPDGVYTLTGQGDIAPDENNPDMVQMSFQGVFVGLLFMATLGTLFVTSEYKRGLIRTTFTATPSRLKVLAAKTTVIGAVTFVTGLPATAIGFTVAQRTLRSNGFKPPSSPTSPSWRTRLCGRWSAARYSCHWSRSWPSPWAWCCAAVRARSRRWWSWCSFRRSSRSPSRSRRRSGC
ncbi:hypothetical protein N7U49_33455 [Streptomyces sp. AD2-2]|nr:hypothetical protein N7U49_33455 [Streptomyces sp. AD2-2]